MFIDQRSVFLIEIFRFSLYDERDKRHFLNMIIHNERKTTYHETSIVLSAYKDITNQFIRHNKIYIMQKTLLPTFFLFSLHEI